MQFPQGPTEGARHTGAAIIGGCELLVLGTKSGPNCWAISPAPNSILVCSWDLLWGLMLVSFCFVFFKDLLLIIICKYTLAVFRHTRRGRQIPLQMVVSHHVVAGIGTQDLWKNTQCSYPLSHLSSPEFSILKITDNRIQICKSERWFRFNRLLACLPCMKP